MLYLLIAVAFGLLLSSLILKPRPRLVLQITVLFAVLAVFPSAGARNNVDLTPTYATLVVMSLCAVFVRGSLAGLIWFAPFLGFLVLGFEFGWNVNNVVRNGIINLCLVIGAWIVGGYFSGRTMTVPGLARSIAVLVLAIISFETVVMILQSAGLPIFPLEGRSDELEGGRANGTFSHPGVAGKILVLLLIVLLPLSRSADPKTRSAASLGFVLSILPVALSGSRSNFVAMLAMVLVWSLIQPGGRFAGKRILMPAVIGGVSLFFVDSIIARFTADPSGGQREHLMSVTLQHLPRYLDWGAGPSAFVQVFGRYDKLIAEDWPVHNMFVLLLSELGIVGTSLFCFPFIAVVLVSLRRLWTPGPSADQGRAVLAAVPALVVIGVAGWGMLTPYSFALLGFVFGWSARRLGLFGGSQGAGASSADSIVGEHGRLTSRTGGGSSLGAHRGVPGSAAVPRRTGGPRAR